MPTDLKVWPIENKFLCFNVESRSDPRIPREVDLESFRFNGECDCPRFEFKGHPLLIRGADPADHLRCSHIKSARSYFLDEILPAIAPKIRPMCEGKTTPAQQAEGMITAIVVLPDDEYPKARKLNDLMALRAHLDAAFEQLAEAA